MRAWKARQCVLILLVASPLALAQHDDADEEEKEAKVCVNSRLIYGFFQKRPLSLLAKRCCHRQRTAKSNRSATALAHFR